MVSRGRPIRFRRSSRSPPPHSRPPSPSRPSACPVVRPSDSPRHRDLSSFRAHAGFQRHPFTSHDPSRTPPPLIFFLSFFPLFFLTTPPFPPFLFLLFSGCSIDRLFLLFDESSLVVNRNTPSPPARRRGPLRLRWTRNDGHERSHAGVFKDTPTWCFRVPPTWCFRVKVGRSVRVIMGHRESSCHRESSLACFACCYVALLQEGRGGNRWKRARCDE